MYRNWILIFVFIGCFFLKIYYSSAQAQPTITVTGNSLPTSIGGVYTLTINVKGTATDKISWDECDYLFKNSTKYFFLDVKFRKGNTNATSH